MALGRHFLTDHPEAAVTGDMDHGLIGVAQLCAQRRPKAEAMVPKPPGGRS